MNLFDLYAKVTLDTSEYEQGLDNASKKSSTFGDVLKANLTGAAIIGGIKAVTGAAVNMGKAIIGSYAEYEQLTGGVETLFKGSSAIVMKYAERAYKTAGLSANEYMATVTSFSASLLQSLGGDTYKASKVADQAIIDMADNANKMGTDIGMIQNAYQGFAKQNYTMLDNLKLGYGGTKEEMQRLIDDANRVKEANGEMGDLSIESFADITEAIHVVQTEMGITGTTAKEAEGTISGSISAMRSAFSNLVTGIADGNADIDVLLDEFLSSVGTVAKNVLPVVKTVLSNIYNTFTENWPQLFAAGVEMLIKVISGILGAIPDLVAALPTVIDTIKQAFIDAWPMMKEAGMRLLEGLWAGIGDKVEWLKGKVRGVIDSIKSWFTGPEGFDEHSPSKWANQVFRYVMEGGAAGLEDGAPALMRSVDDVTSRVKNGMDFGVASVDFASSGLGVSSAGMINGMASTRQANNSGNMTVNLVLPDGTKLASYMLPSLAAVARANGTPIINPA